VHSPAIEVQNLVVRYAASPEPVTAVNGISFTAATGSICTLLGPNGAGKTSTVETMEGYRKPTGGTVKVLGLDPIADSKALLPRMGVMLQRNGVYVTMTPAESIKLFAAYYPGRARNPQELIDRLGLARVSSTPWRRLSGGEQQRVSMALALVGRPDVVFLDEPTAGIDPGARLVVRDVINDLRADGVTVILTTHDLEEAEKLSDQIIIIDRGSIVASGSPQELMKASTGDGIRFGAVPGLGMHRGVNVLDELSHVLHNAAVSEERPGEYVAACAPSPANVAALTNCLANHDLSLSDLRAGRHTLEDVFLRLTADANTADVAAREPVASGSRGRGRRSRNGSRNGSQGKS
jgi:ABC-2 type transport system ATP-binding protein